MPLKRELRATIAEPLRHDPHLGLRLLPTPAVLPSGSRRNHAKTQHRDKASHHHPDKSYLHLRAPRPVEHTA